MDRFRESALNGTAGLSRDTVKDMELLLVYPDNEYCKVLTIKWQWQNII